MQDLKVQEGEPASRPGDRRATCQELSSLVEVQPTRSPAGLLVASPGDLTQLGSQRAPVPRNQSFGDRNRVEKAGE